MTACRIGVVKSEYLESPHNVDVFPHLQFTSIGDATYMSPFSTTDNKFVLADAVINLLLRDERKRHAQRTIFLPSWMQKSEYYYQTMTLLQKLDDI